AVVYAGEAHTYGRFLEGGAEFMFTLQQLPFDSFAFGYVGNHRHDGRDFASGIVNRRCMQADVDEHAVLALPLELFADQDLSLADTFTMLGKLFQLVIRDIREPPALDLRFAPAEDPLRCRVPDLYLAVLIEEEYRLGRCLDKRPKHFIAVAQFFFRTLAFSDVLDHFDHGSDLAPHVFYGKRTYLEISGFPSGRGFRYGLMHFSILQGFDDRTVTTDLFRRRIIECLMADMPLHHIYPGKPLPHLAVERQYLHIRAEQRDPDRDVVDKAPVLLFRESQRFLRFLALGSFANLSQSTPDGRQKPGEAVLEDVVGGAALHGVNGNLFPHGPGDEDERQVGEALPDHGQRCHAVESRQGIVSQDQVNPSRIECSD